MSGILPDLLCRRIRKLEAKVVNSENQTGDSVELKSNIHGTVCSPSQKEPTYMHVSSVYDLTGMQVTLCQLTVSNCLIPFRKKSRQSESYLRNC